MKQSYMEFGGVVDGVGWRFARVPALTERGSTRMPKVSFTANIQRHVACPDTEAPGATVAEVMGRVFAANPRARGYVLDDQGALRHHMLIFIDGEIIHDRRGLSDPVAADATIHVFQALSGG